MKSLFLKSLSAFALFVVFSIQTGQCQALGDWKTYMAYQNATMVAVDSKGYVYAVYKGYPYGSVVPSDGSLLRYDPSRNEVRTISKANGLNDVYISRIAYVESEKTLVIVYDNGNIDLYDTEREIVYNLADLKNNTSIQDKTANEIDVYDDYAYISLNSGISVIDVKNKVIKDFYQIRKKTYSICFWKENNIEYVYVATEEGIKRADRKKNLSSESTWEPYSLSYGGDPSLITKVLTVNGNFVFYQKWAGIFYQTASDAPQAIAETPVAVNQITTLNNQLVLVDGANIYIYSDLASAPTTIPAQGSVYVSSRNSSTYWVAREYEGISGIDKNTGVMSAPITKNSPKRNLIYDLTWGQGKLLIVGGGMYGVFFNNPGTFMVMEENGDWLNLNENAVRSQLISQGYDDRIASEFMYAVVDPRDKDHYFVGSAVGGVFEFKGYPTQDKIDFINLYNDRNSNNKIGSAVQGNSSYVWIQALAYDANANLYMTAISDNGIVIYTKNNDWISYYDSNIANKFLLREFIITTKNQKWIIATRPISHTGGVFVWNDNNTIDNPMDDISYFQNSFTDQDGEKLGITFFNCVVEDSNGTIWVGTDIGPIIFYNPLSITASNTTEFNRCSRIKMPRNDGTDLADYLLDGVNISTIAVDGANRKWIGTKGFGVFVVSPTGEEVLANYTAENSPLLSNEIVKIVINNKEKGEVFIGTDKGLISLINPAIEGKADYSNVYAYPNPVRPDFLGEVVVTGLVKDSDVKITDLSGNIIYQGTSLGGQFVWNCKNRYGERVKTGVYLVFAATSDGMQGIVTKIVVIK